jgi:hypothetical protein
MIQSIYSPDSYTGNGILTTFAFNWGILAKTDLIVQTKDTAGTVEILDLNSDYTVSDFDVNTADGGDVVLAVPLATGTELFISRHTAQTQLVNIEEGSPFPAAVVTKEFDRLTMMIQDLQYQIHQALRFPPTSGIEDVYLPEPSAGALLQWNSTEDALQNINASALGLDHLIITQAVTAGATGAVITHNLNSLAVSLIGFSSTWFTGFIITGQTLNTITISVSVECPPGGGTIVTEVAIS